MHHAKKIKPDRYICYREMSKIATFKGGEIAYTDKGSGTAVVFLHGFLESRDMWRYYVNKLPKKFRTICIDLPGHGESQNFGYNHPMELMAEAVHAVVKQEKLRKVTIVGHSLGGYVGIAYAELYPDILKGLVMYFSSAACDSDEKKINRNRAIKLVKQDHKSFIRNSIPMLFAEHNRDKYMKTIQRLVAKANKMGPQSIIAALEGMRDRNDREIVVKFAPFPVHYVIGELDPVLPAEILLKQAEISEKGSYTLLKKTGHMGFIENKKETFLAVKSFLESL